MRVFITAFLGAILMACAPAVYQPGDAPPDGFPRGSSSLGQSCGGFTVGPAPMCSGENEYCHRSIGDYCGAADAPGTCKVKPEMCTMNYDPVCGCDGKTYSNECVANSKGVSASITGECPK